MMADASWAATPFLCLLVTAVLLGYAYFRHSRRRLYELAARIPGKEGLPFIGSALEYLYLGSPHDLFQRAWKDMSAFPTDTPLKMWMGPVLVLGLQDPRDIEAVLSSPASHRKSAEYDFFRPWFGEGLLISTGEHWRSHRRLIAPTFHLHVLKTFIALFNRNSREVVGKLRAERGREFDVHDRMSEATVDMLLETVMGVDKRRQPSSLEYAEAVLRMCDILHKRHVRMWLRPEALFRLSPHAAEHRRLLAVIQGLTRRVVRDKTAAFERSARGSLALQHGNDATATEEAIVEEEAVVEEEATRLAADSTGLSFGQSARLRDDLDADDVGEKRRSAFLEHLVETAAQGGGSGSACPGFTARDVEDEANTIMFEGHDTTAAASSFFLCLMGLHQQIQARFHHHHAARRPSRGRVGMVGEPNVLCFILKQPSDFTAVKLVSRVLQNEALRLAVMLSPFDHDSIFCTTVRADKVVDELDRIFGDSDRPATFQDTLEMKYLERCLLETLRLYPPVPVIARTLSEEITIPHSGLVLPTGCTVVVAIFKLHRNEAIYPNPDVFDPDNFLPERCVDRHYYSFIPFSAGARSCVGRKYAMLKLKILLSTILRHYRVHATVPEKDFRLRADIILKRTDGFKISVVERASERHDKKDPAVNTATAAHA